MNIPSSWRYGALLGLVAAALLPWIGHRIRRQEVAKCALDGAVTRIAMRVRIRSTELGESEFCSIYCAEKWLNASQTQPHEIFVTDEATGQLLDAREVFFVRSQIITQGTTQDRRHVFAKYHDAKNHAESHRGRVLEGTDRPFALWLDQQSEQTSSDSSPKRMNKSMLSEPEWHQVILPRSADQSDKPDNRALPDYERDSRSAGEPVTVRRRSL